jgi:hypothetical protein
VQTTESSEIGRLDLDSATALIMEPEEAPVSEEITEEEIEQPTEDPIDESEDYEETDESDASDNDDEEEEEAEADDESEEESDEDEYEDEEDEAEEEGPEKDLHTVTVDGEEIQVNLDELKRGYSGQKYVQKGMQQAAEAKKEAEGVYGALMQERQQLAQLLQQAQNGDLVPPKPPSDDLWENDPLEYLGQKKDYDKKVAEYQQKMGQVQQQLQQQSVAEQRAQVVYAQQEAQKLVESLPELKDPKKADQFQRNLLSGAQKYFNYTPEQVGMIRNHQDFVTLHHAIKYAELMEGKPQAEKKVRKAKPAIKPGAKKTASKTKAHRDRMAKLRKSGNPLDALDLLIDPNLR